MKPLFVCTQTVNRYDCLEQLIISCVQSTRQPDHIWIVDHGYNEVAVRAAVDPVIENLRYTVITFEDPSCAYNANWFLKNIPDDKVGCGDDVIFEPTALERMAATPGHYIIPQTNLNPAACCLMRQSCVDLVGYFDEGISPGYLYFEDPDYHRRMMLAGIWMTVCEEAMVTHYEGGSQTHHRTMEHPKRAEEHHIRFQMAAANYVWKWGGMPGDEKLTVPRPWPRPHGWPDNQTVELPHRTKEDVLRYL